MSTCQNIEHLIYLYRDGELAVEERTKVSEHIKTCSGCQQILQQLLSIDNALVQVRETVPELSTAVVRETIDRISGKSTKRHRGKEGDTLLDEVLGWLRPALSIGLAAASLLFLIQQSRDTANVVELENRLHARGDVVASEASQQSDLVSLRQGVKGLISSKPTAAAIVSDPTAILGPGFMDLFRHNPKLFEELSSRYPNLSSITLDDGIDERERKILSTEGKAFIKEFEQMINQGEK